MDAPLILALAGYEQQIASQMRVSWDCSVFYSHSAAPRVRMPATRHPGATAAAQVHTCPIDKSRTLGGRGAMAQPGKTFKHRIDSIADPELLETERRSLQRLLIATRDARQFREAAAKTAYILDRLKTLADEESEAERDQ
jgi:hypothetical protein